VLSRAVSVIIRLFGLSGGPDQAAWTEIGTVGTSLRAGAGSVRSKSGMVSAGSPIGRDFALAFALVLDFGFAWNRCSARWIVE